MCTLYFFHFAVSKLGNFQAQARRHHLWEAPLVVSGGACQHGFSGTKINFFCILCRGWQSRQQERIHWPGDLAKTW